MIPNVAITHMQDVDLASRPSGEAKSYYVNRRWWPLALNLEAVNVGLQIEQLSANAQVTVHWEYSWDGINWLTSASPVVSTQNSVGLKPGRFDVASEIATFGRLRVDVEHSGSSSMVDATLSLRALYILKS